MQNLFLFHAFKMLAKLNWVFCVTMQMIITIKLYQEEMETQKIWNLTLPRMNLDY